MGSGALKLSPNYDTLSWSVEISVCGLNSMNRLNSITEPFIILGINGPSKPGRIYIHTIPMKEPEKMIIPLCDPNLNKEMIADISFKGLSRFNKDWTLILYDRKTNKVKEIRSQDSVLVRPGFCTSSDSIKAIHKNVSISTRLELHISFGNLFNEHFKNSGN